MEIMDEYRMARRMLILEVSGGQVPSRPRLGWIDGVKVELSSRGMAAEGWRQRDGGRGSAAMSKK